MNAFVCSTPIQIVRAIYMKYAMGDFTDSADIYIIPTFSRVEMIAENIKQTGLFRNVYLFDVKGLNRAVSVQLIYGNNEWAKQFRRFDYKKIIAFNIESDLLNALYNRNKFNEGFEYHYVEDAPGMYKMYAPSKNSFFSLKRIVKISQPYYNTNQWWFSNPDFMEIPNIEFPNVNKLPSIDINDDVFVDLINRIFAFSPDDILENADILITEESFFIDGKMVDDYDYILYEEIRNYFNNKKIAVKLHPRTKINRFENKFEIMKSTWIPWEIYLMNGLRYNQHFPIQIGIACSALTSDKFMFDAESPKIVLAPLFKDKIQKFKDGSSNVDDYVIRRYEDLKSIYVNPNQMVIAYNKDVLFDTLKMWL